MNAPPPTAPGPGPAPPAPPNSAAGNPPAGAQRVVKRMIRRPDGTVVEAPPATNLGGASANPTKVVKRMIRRPDGTVVEAPPAAKADGTPADPNRIVNRMIRRPDGTIVEAPPTVKPGGISADPKKANAPTAAPGPGEQAIPAALRAGSSPQPPTTGGPNAGKLVQGVGQAPTAPTNVNQPRQPMPPPNMAAPGAVKAAPTGAPQPVPTGAPKAGPLVTARPAPTGVAKTAGATANPNPIVTAVGTEVAVGVGKGINLIFDGLSKKINQDTSAPKATAKPTDPKATAAKVAAGAPRGPPAPGAFPQTGPRSLDFASYPPQANYQLPYGAQSNQYSQPGQYAPQPSQYPPQLHQYPAQPNVPIAYNVQYHNQQHHQQPGYGQQYAQAQAPAVGLARDYYEPPKPAHSHSHVAATGLAGAAGGLAVGGGAVLAYDAVTGSPTGHSHTIVNRDIEVYERPEYVVENTTVYTERPDYVVESEWQVSQPYYQGGAEVEVIETRDVNSYGNFIDNSETIEYVEEGGGEYYEEIIEEVPGETFAEQTYITEGDGVFYEQDTTEYIQEGGREYYQETDVIGGDIPGEIYIDESTVYTGDGGQEFYEEPSMSQTETEVQEYNGDGELVESVDQTTTVDELGNVEVESEVIEEDGNGGYNEEYQDDTYVNEGDGDDGYGY